MKCIVYDHKGSEGALQQWAATDEDISPVEETHVDKAVTLLLESDADVMFVHLDDHAAWNRLTNEVAESKAVFRLSSVGFAPTEPMGKAQNCFHVNPPTSGAGALSGDQLTEFRDALKKADVLPTLRAGQIPSAIRPFIWFEEPHLARAIHILLQARLAQWAGDPGHPLRDQAGEALGYRGRLPRFSRHVDWGTMLRKLLGSAIHAGRTSDTSPADTELINAAKRRMCSELSIKEKDACKSPIKEVDEVIKEILNSSPAQEQNDPKQFDAKLFSFVKSAYDCLDVVCRGQRMEGA